jgi:hypothetical protein
MLFSENMILTLSPFLKQDEMADIVFDHFYPSVQPLKKSGMGDGL